MIVTLRLFSIGGKMAKEAKRRSRRVAALLAIVYVGTFGAHKFYVGNAKAGAAHIVALIVAAIVSNGIGFMLPIMLISAFACVEGIIYALKSDDEFDRQYVRGGRAFL